MSSFYPSVWARPLLPTGGRKGLSRQQIVTEAVTLLDAEGIEALSMRRLGTSLGAGATSLYRHVANRAELIELVVDEVYGEITIPAAETRPDWKTVLVACAHGMRQTILSHPWLASVLGSTGMANFGPHLMRLTEDILTALVRDGFSPEDANEATTLTFSYAIGATTSVAALHSTLRRNHLTEEQWLEELWPAVQSAVQPYPLLSKIYDDQRGRENAQYGSRFDFGLERILDGLAAIRNS